LAAALRDGRLPPQATACDPGELIEAAAREGVLALLELRLREGSSGGTLPVDLQDGLAEGARSAAVQWLLRERELRRIAVAFGQGGFRVLLLKGSALALWLYPQPYLRMGGDIDLLFASRAEAERAAMTLSELGYALAFVPGSMHYEMTSRLVVDGVMRSELDLHFRLLNSVSYAEVFGFDEIWQEAILLPGIQSVLRALSPLHALAHASLNRALDMQNGIPDRLKLLYDVRLLAARNGEAEWRALCELASSKGIAGPCLRSLEDASCMLGSALPAGVHARLREIANAEPLDYHRMGDWRYMQWQNLKALPGLRERVRWLRESLLPSTQQLHELYGDGGWWTLMMRRIGRGLARLR
jgi:hypothetical protein